MCTTPEKRLDAIPILLCIFKTHQYMKAPTKMIKGANFTKISQKNSSCLLYSQANITAFNFLKQLKMHIIRGSKIIKILKCFFTP